MIDFANQIANLITKYAPFAGIDIGQKYQATNINDTAGKITMTFSPSDYQSLMASMNASNIQNTTYTLSGFYTKNTIISFTSYPADSPYKYGVIIKFKLPHKLNTNQLFTLKEFVNTVYNTEYKTYSIINPYEIVAFISNPNIPNITITTNLGFLPVQYTEGLNGIRTISNEGINQLSFLYDKDLLLVDVLDLNFMPFIHYYNGNVLAINASTFFANLTNESNDEYLILDTTSLVGVSVRSNNNKTDLAYNTFSRSGRFDKSYTINLLYLLERNEDDANNQTISGSDIVSKQVGMFDSLISIIRQPLEGNSAIISSISIGADRVDQSISEGRVVIVYPLMFASLYQEDIMLDIDDIGIYPIDSLKLNNDEIDLTKF